MGSLTQTLCIPGQTTSVCPVPTVPGRTNQVKVCSGRSCNALSWVHAICGLDNPSTHPFLKTVLEGLRHSLAKPVIKKEPVTVEMLEAMVRDAEESGILSDLTTACLLAFSGFLSW